jgi:hypothetical protein
VGRRRVLLRCPCLPITSVACVGEPIQVCENRSNIAERAALSRLSGPTRRVAMLV